MTEEEAKQILNKIKNIRLHEYETGVETAINTLEKIQKDLKLFTENLEVA